MSAGADNARRPLRPRLLAALAIFAVLAIFAGANAHLVYVAVVSQPDCVPHRVGPDGSPAPLRAAKPAC
jgi:hypothetical protein